MTEADPKPTAAPASFRTLITGDRNWHCPVLAREVVRRLKVRHGDRLVIVHGAARGVDRSFAEAAELAKVKVEAYPADWDRYGDAAEPRRNAEMVASGIDLAVAVHRTLGRSRGTRDCVAKCLAAGISTWLIDSGDPTPRPIRKL